MWILQEIIFAPKPVLMCGSEVLPWDRLAAFLRVLRSANSFFETKSVEHALLMDKQRLIFQAQGRGKITEGTLLSLLESTKTFRSSDGKDKLYALLNITNDHLRIVPGYTMPCIQWQDVPPNTTVFGLLRRTVPIEECRYREMGLGEPARITLF
jgi:hypothetical protein